MTGIPIRDIEGALVDRISSSTGGLDYVNGHNFAITQQGSVKITLNRGKLANIISNYMKTPRTTEKIIAEFYTNCGLELADAIIANLKDLLEVVK